jgi:hypothetical protein
MTNKSALLQLASIYEQAARFDFVAQGMAIAVGSPLMVQLGRDGRDKQERAAALRALAKEKGE